MINIEYANAYVEVLEILKYISIEDYNKIPKNEINLFEKNANKDYNFSYNLNQTLDEQNVSKIAKGIIAILFRDYWATESQREQIIIKQNDDRQKIEEEKRIKYNPDNIFVNNNKNTTINDLEKNQETALIEIKDMKWYTKIWRLLTKFLIK